jgi:hypothetical protein
LSADLREAIAKAGEALLHVALRPDLEAGDRVVRLCGARGKQSFSNFLRKTLQLSAIATGLLQEAAIAAGLLPTSLSPEKLAA